jgi:hypothetical protein
MWLSAIKLAVSAGSHIYKNKQETKMLMSDAEKRHALAMAKGEKEYQGKLLTSRDSDWKDEFILLLLSLPIVFLGWQFGLTIQSIWKRCNYSLSILETFLFGTKQFLLG